MRPKLLAPLLLCTACARAAAPPQAPPPAPPLALPAVAPAYDLLVLGGRVMDGTGAASVRADVAIRGDRIAAVGMLPGVVARDTIDASGQVVAPGFIDMLGHSEYPLLADGRAISKITQGITSEVTGEVTSVVPVNENTLRELGDARALVSWTDLDGYFRALEAARPAINLATYVTVGSVRRAVMGDADRAPTAGELDRMRGMVDEAMRQGAIGLSSGLAYAPASFASSEEIAELAKVAARYGGGYASHIRSEGSGLIPAIQEAIGVGERAGTWVEIHHLKASGQANWGKMREAVATIEAARARGVDVAADIYPYVASGTGLSNILPGWVHEGGTEALLARLRDPAARARIKAELLAEGGGTDAAIGGSAGGPAGVMISDVVVDSLAKYEGMRLDAVARARGQSVPDALLDLLLADHASTAAVYFSMSEPDVELALRQPWVSVGIDAGARAADSTVHEQPHPRAYGSFPRILCRYVRERGVIPMEEAVRRFTSLPAGRVGLRDRGVVRAGYFADLTLFDPATVCDRATFEAPVQTSVGIAAVIVNGTPVLRDGVPTGARPGRGLRRGR